MFRPCGAPSAPAEIKTKKTIPAAPLALCLSLSSLSLFSSPSTSSLPLLFSPYNPHTHNSRLPAFAFHLLLFLFNVLLFCRYYFLYYLTLLVTFDALDYCTLGYILVYLLTSSSLDIYFFFFFIFFQYVDLLLPATTSAAAPSPRPCHPHAVE